METHAVCISIWKLWVFLHLYHREKEKIFLIPNVGELNHMTSIRTFCGGSFILWCCTQHHQSNRLASLMEVHCEVYSVFFFFSSGLFCSRVAFTIGSWCLKGQGLSVPANSTISSLASCFPGLCRVMSWEIWFVKICVIFSSQRCVKNSRQEGFCLHNAVFKKDSWHLT